MPPLDLPTVLVVSPDPRTRSVLKNSLRDDGFRVLAASGALEALLAGARQPGGIQLLAASPDLPGIDGRRLADKFRQAFPGLPVVFLSAAPAESLDRIREVLAPARKQPGRLAVHAASAMAG